MDYEPPANQMELGADLVERHGIDTSQARLLDCAHCHR
jgi:hypothetical protein